MHEIVQFYQGFCTAVDPYPLDTQAAHEVYEAVKSAGSAASSGAASAWQADPVGKAGAVINDAAGGAYDATKVSITYRRCLKKNIKREIGISINVWPKRRWSYRWVGGRTEVEMFVW